jgi:hypothetical protein
VSRSRFGSCAEKWVRRLQSSSYGISMGLRNALCRTKVTGAVAVVVSMTSYGQRLRTVHLAIESIGCGIERPQQLILWIDDEAFFKKPSRQIRRLQRRGLTVKYTLNYGPHKKFFPYVKSASSHVVPLATVDDDTFYPRNWLRDLRESYERDPSSIHAQRARLMKVSGGSFRPYEEWTLVCSQVASAAHIATGVCGVLYPPSFLSVLRQAGDGFLSVCPKADDLWLKAQALRAGVPVRQVSKQSAAYLPILRTSRNNLMIANVGSLQNDAQIIRTFTEKDVALVGAAGRDAVSTK